MRKEVVREREKKKITEKVFGPLGWGRTGKRERRKKEERRKKGEGGFRTGGCLGIKLPSTRTCVAKIKQPGRRLEVRQGKRKQLGADGTKKCSAVLEVWEGDQGVGKRGGLWKNAGPKSGESRTGRHKCGRTIMKLQGPENHLRV